MQRVRLTYFRDTGKFAGDGSFDVPSSLAMFQIFETAQQMRDERRLPGITGDRFYVLVEAPGHQHEHPHLILPKTSEAR